MKTEKPYTELCTHSLTSIHYRDKNLVDDILGKKTFTEVMFSQILNREPSEDDLKVIDAALIAIMEHGLTPSAISARLIYMSAPDNLQGGVAAGLLGVGGQFIGTVENSARNLRELIDAPEGIEAAALAMVQRHRAERKTIAGFGQHMHKPDDPRAAKLIEIGMQHTGFEGKYLQALKVLSAAVDKVYGKHITINATGAVGALLGELNVPVELMRGFAVISRAAGLVAHIAEEQRIPSARHIWDVIDHEIPYKGDGEGHNKARDQG
ncbi:citryl-CoA lyase [Allopusillimonas ginsengisoli]|uniref:citryl-CoA lyase n=1 Tax=Allopusillimonas ginsengisoli TaxID=453575 RepID=UPI0010C22540|nr:citryl-CoA lyase [Allopusillimonas ginsengisoli]